MAEPLREELRRLRNSVAHLVATQEVLKAELQGEGPKDPDFKAAFDENIVVIAKSRARIESLVEELSKIEAGAAEVATIEEDAASVEAGPSGAAAGGTGGGDTMHVDQGAEGVQQSNADLIQQQRGAVQQQQQPTPSEGGGTVRADDGAAAGEGLWL